MFSKSTASKRTPDCRIARDRTAASLDLEVLEVRENPATLVPSAVDDLYQLDNEVVLRVDVAHGVLTNDFDLVGGLLQAELLANDTGGSLNLRPDGSFDFRPDGVRIGPVTFTYRAFDGAQHFNPATVTINRRPISGDIDIVAEFRTGIAVPATTGLLTNSTDADGNPLTASVFCDPDRGTVTIAPDGSYTYTPLEGFSGVDYFSYRVFDGTAYSRPSLVTVNVSPNRAPVAVADSYSTFHNDTLTVAAPGVLSNDSDANADPLTASLTATATHGTLTFAVNGSFTYRATAGYVGTDTFRYRVSDDSLLSDEVTVTIDVVDRAPVAVADTARALGGFALDAPSVLGNDTDADGDALTAQLVEGSGPANGTLIFNPDGTYRYTSVVGYAGTDTFSYRAFDGFRFSDAATVTITVDANHPPVGGPDSVSTREGFPVSFFRARLLDNDSDPDGNPISFAGFSQPANGTLTLSGTTFTYTPDAGFFGDDTFTYRISDGVLESANILVTVHVIADNPPVATDLSYATDFGTVLTVTAAAGLLSTTTDLDGDGFSAQLVTLPTGETLTSFGSDGSFEFRPDSGFSGTVTFTYTASDGVRDSDIQTVTIVVGPNAPPTTSDDNYFVRQNRILISPFGVLDNDFDTDGPLTATLFSSVANGRLDFRSDGTFVYTPDPGFVGTDSFVYSAFDPFGATRTANVSIAVAANRAPSAVADVYTTRVDTTSNVTPPGVLANDIDLDGDILTAQKATDPANGTLTFALDGSFVYVPNAGFVGDDTFQYYVSDDLEQADSPVSVTIHVIAAVAPVARDDSYGVVQGRTLSNASFGASVLDNDGDAFDAPVSAALLADVSFGTLVFGSDGHFTYDAPRTELTATTTNFTYRTTFASGATADATVTIDIFPNFATRANSDSYSVGRGQRLTVDSSIGVLNNDYDNEGDPRTAVRVSDPSVGTLLLNSDGTFTYFSTLGSPPTVTFTYRADDGFAFHNTTGSSNLATVTIFVAGNGDPVANPDSYSVVGGTTLTVPASRGLLANDTDPDGNALSISVDPVSGPTSGTLTDLRSNGAFTYVPDPLFVGTVTFRYRLFDGAGGSSIGTVTIDVTAPNSPPVANDDTFVLREGGTLPSGTNNILANDRDADDPLSAPSIASDVRHGTLVLFADGTFSYTPNPGYFGTDSFTYSIFDGVTRATATITFTIVADNPPIGVADAYSVRQGFGLPISASDGVLRNDTDADGDPLSPTLRSSTSHGTLDFRTDGGFTYRPNAGYFGSDSFTYSIFDGVRESAPVTVSINVVRNNPPVALGDTLTLTESTFVILDATTILGNDTDADGDLLRVDVVCDPQHGTVTREIFNETFRWVYRPFAYYSGADSFTYRAFDGIDYSNTVAVDISISAVNNAPLAFGDYYEAAYLTPLSGAVKTFDPDGPTRTFTLLSGPANDPGFTFDIATGAFTYTRQSENRVRDSFIYSVSDGLNSAMATVWFNYGDAEGCPKPPNIDADAFDAYQNNVVVGNVLANDSNSSFAPLLRATLLTGPTHGTLVFAGDGSFVYTPDLNYFGTDTFTYRGTNDGDRSRDAVVTITVHHVNQTPVGAADVRNATEDTPLTFSVAGLLANDTDVDGDPIAFSQIATGPTHGTLTLTNGSYTYTPVLNYNGIDSFTYTITDGCAVSSPIAVTLNIAPVNDAPVALGESTITDEDTPLVIDPAGLLANDSDVDNVALTIVVVAPPSHGTLALQQNGTYVYSPAPDYNGSDSFTYRVSDGSLLSNVVAVNIRIVPVEDAPVARADAYAFDEDTTLAASVLANDFDVDGDALAATLVSGPTRGSFSFQPNGSFVYTPAANYNGFDSFTYRIGDGILDSATVTVSLTIRPIDDAPVGVGDAFSLDEDVPFDFLAVFLLQNDSDIENDNLFIVEMTQPAHGTILRTDIGYRYIPNADYNGPDSFSYRTSDGQKLSGDIVVLIAVRPVEDAPVARDDGFKTVRGQTVLLSVAGLLANDTDVDGDSLSIAGIGQPLHGRLEVRADGTIAYIPNSTFVGTDTFTYTISDGILESRSATVSIVVSPPLEIFTPPTSSTVPMTPFVATPGDPVPRTDVNVPVFAAFPVPSFAIDPVVSLGLGSQVGGSMMAPNELQASIANARGSLGSIAASLGLPDVSRSPTSLEPFVTQYEVKIPEVAERSKLLQLLASPFDEDHNTSVMLYALNRDEIRVVVTQVVADGPGSTGAMLQPVSSGTSVAGTDPTTSEGHSDAEQVEYEKEVTVRELIGWAMVTGAVGSMAAAVASKFGWLKVRRLF